MEHVECIMTSSTNSCTPESGVENLHQIQRETGGLDNIPTISGLSVYSMWAPATSNLTKQILCIELQ
jgi:hypothetical protein